jgi:APA family basic amino acid/polyamine antiporter
MVRAVSRNDSDSVARLGLWPAIALVVGHTIAVGIFVTPAELIGALASPALVIALWAVFGVLVFCGALSFGELASRHPEAGGPYVFLREAWGERLAFLYGWQCLLVMDPGVIAALAAGLGEYLSAAWPATASYSRWLAIGIMWALAAVNAAGLGVSSRLMSRLTVLKLAALGGIVGLGFVIGDGSWNNLRPFVARRPGSVPIGEALALGSVAGFFSFGGFWEASRVAGEVRDPQRTLPRALAIGVALVATVYLVTSVAFMYLVPPDKVTSAAVFASLAGEALFGPSGGQVLATIVVISIVASMMGLLLMAPRVYYAMSRDRLFPNAIARLHPRRGVPDRATLLLAAVATLYASVGTFQQIVSFFICTALAFVALAVAGIVVFRRRAAAPAPFQTPGYPVTPALFIALVSGVILLVLMARPVQALAGIALVLCGIPAHFLSRWNRS